uniref:FIIND domain-containing protein n=1 Tax=Pelusios castaneus TaxID=367368 RepID=A0A8C8SBF5_9SAUR
MKKMILRVWGGTRGGRLLPKCFRPLWLCREEGRCLVLFDPFLLTLCRVHLPEAGSFYCSETELGFEVRAAVTIQYGYDSWARRLNASEKLQWMVAGPLFNIQVEPARTVTAVHLPHFLCLTGGDADVSHLQVAHFVDEGLILESPTRVRPFHAVQENPSFSPIGLLWRQIYSTLFPPVHSMVLLYRSSQAEDITLHLYLIPRDLSVKEAQKGHNVK